MLFWAGVDLFFVISGFLITNILIRAKRTKGQYFRSFYARRVLRIFPVYYSLLALEFIILPLFGIHPAGSDTEKFSYYYWTFTSNYLPLLTGSRLMLGHLWTIAVEEQFYLCWPLLIYLASEKTLRWLFPVLLALGVGLRIFLLLEGRSFVFVKGIPFTHADGLLLGGWLVFALSKGYRFCVPKPRWITLSLILSAVLPTLLTLNIFGLTADSDSWDWLQGGFVVLALSLTFAWLLALSINLGNIVSNAFSSKILRWVGTYSYGLYLWHFPVAWMLRAPLGSLTANVAQQYHPLLAHLVFVAAMLAASMTVAVLSWKLIEQPFLKLKKCFPYQRATPAGL